MFSNRYMAIALQQAKLAAEHGEIPVGAVIVQNKEIIAQACNGVEKYLNPLAHAEMIAIDIARKRLGQKYLTDCNIYISLEPCLMCFKAISLMRINSLYFSVYNPSQRSIEKYSLRDLDITHRCTIYGGVLEEYGQKIIDDFFSKIRSSKND